MDPTIVKGNMFTCKGAQNHVVSDMWKSAVRRELSTARSWANSFNKKGAEAERKWLESVMHETQATHPKHATSRALLPSALRGKAGEEEDSAARARGVGVGRAELLKQHREQHLDSLRVGASSRDIGSRATDRENPVLMAERLGSPIGRSHGRKPIIAGSFFRRSGVF